jgi:hypothetical protein
MQIEILGRMTKVLGRRDRCVPVLLDAPNQKSAFSKLAGKVAVLGRSIVNAQHQLQLISSQ